ncbi:hypothetical protein D3C84_1248660 [compost metagenome]
MPAHQWRQQAKQLAPNTADDLDQYQVNEGGQRRKSGGLEQIVQAARLPGFIDHLTQGLRGLFGSLAR